MAATLRLFLLVLFTLVCASTADARKRRASAEPDAAPSPSAEPAPSAGTAQSSAPEPPSSAPVPAPEPERVAPAPASAQPASTAAPTAKPAASARPAPVQPPVPAPSGSAAPDATAVDVHLHDNVVFRLRTAHAGQSVAERARAAEQALNAATDNASPDDVRVVQQGDVAVLFVAKIPVVQLYADDARLAGDSSLDVHAASVAARIREAMRAEQKRSAIAGTVFSFSIVIFCGLLALYLIRKVGDLGERAFEFVRDNPERIPALRVQSIEVVRPSILRAALLGVLGFGKWVLQLGIAYGWLVLSLSLFASTRAYTERLTGFVLGPVSDLLGRFAASLPVLLVAGIAAVAIYVLVRFVGLFFASVARGETSLPWLSADLAPATSLLLRAAIVVFALVFGAPVVTGDSEGALARSGTVLLVAFALAGTPVLASGAIGTIAVFLRRLRVGEFAEFGGRSGRVLAVGLLEVRLEDDEGCEVRVPHLLSLVHPTRLLGEAPRLNVSLNIALSAWKPHLDELLLAATAGLGDGGRVEVVRIESESLTLRVSLTPTRGDARDALQRRVLELLAREKTAVLPKRPTAP